VKGGLCTTSPHRETVVRVARRLIPLIVISYLVAHIDRANIAFAALTMNRDLGFSAYIYGWGAGIFFLGYALFEVPSNLILVRIGARIWIARIMITWGISGWAHGDGHRPIQFPDAAIPARRGGSRVFLTLAIVAMLHLVSLTGLTFFMPQMVKALGTSTAMAAALTAIPYVIGVIGPIAAGYSSDRLKERRWHYIGAMALAALSLVCAGRVISSYWLLLATSGAALGIYASKPCFWPIPSQFLTGVGAAAGIALINSIANVGGYVGPLVVGWVKDSTHSFEAALYFLAACALASALLAYVGTRTVGRAL
jgi:MFS family permease